MIQFSYPFMTTGKTIALTRLIFVGTVMSLLFNMLSRFVIAFFSRNKHLLISWLQSASAVILEPKKIKICHCFHFSPFYLPWCDKNSCPLKLTFNRDEIDLEEKGGRLIVNSEAGNIMDYAYVLEGCGKALVEFVPSGGKASLRSVICGRLSGRHRFMREKHSSRRKSQVQRGCNRGTSQVQRPEHKSMY